MPLPDDPNYYIDCYDLYEKALASPLGVQKVCATEGEAKNLQHRLHKARVINRKLNHKIWPEGHLLHNASEFYRITVKIVKDEKRGLWLLRLEKKELRQEEVEEIVPEEIERAAPAKRPELLDAPEFARKQEHDLWRLMTRGSKKKLEPEPLNPEGEFDLEEPERPVEPSPERASRLRRL